MTGSPLWKEFESGDSVFMKLLRFVVLVGGVFILGFTGILDLTWPQQAVLGLLTVLAAI
jgi:cellulose synthase (UDP-forming)